MVARTRWREVNRLNPSETEALAEYIQSLPLYLTIDGAKEGRDGQLLMTHSGFQADYIVREPDGSINVVKTIESSARSDLFKHLVSNDIHYIPTADRKAFDRTVLVGHVPVMRLNYDGSYKIRRDRNLISIDSGRDTEKVADGCHCTRSRPVRNIIGKE